MKIYGLNKALSASQNVVAKVKKGSGYVHKIIRLEKGKTYELPDDPYLEESLLSKTTEIRYAPNKEEYLKSQGVDYEIVLCKQCGGKVKKIKLKTAFVEEVADGEYE